MFIFSPARKKRLRTNTGCFPAEWLNQTSREARRRKERLERAQERKAKNKSCRMFPAPATATNKPPTHHESHRPKKPCCYQQQSTATAPRMPHRAHEKGQQV